MCQTNTADYQEKFLQFLIWFIFTAATLSAVVGLGMKYIIMRKLVQEDWLIILAQVRSPHYIVLIGCGTNASSRTYTLRNVYRLHSVFQQDLGNLGIP